MHSKLFVFIRGYVAVDIRGNKIEAFMNAAINSGCHIWHMNRTSPTSVRVFTDLNSFFRFKSILRQTGCTMHVHSRLGLPFLFNKMEARLFFVMGLVLFILGIYVLSQLVWRVDVEGNERISYDDIMAVAEQQGIHTFQWKFKLQEPEVLSRAFTHALPGAAWVGVEVKGTRVRIQVVEQTLPEPKPLMNPRHLVSNVDAVITNIFVERGRPMVKPHMKVKKGDILVSGIIGNEENKHVVVAEGKVRGLVWHIYNIQAPLTHQHKVYTGQSKVRQYFVIGNRALQLTGYGKLPFAASQSDSKRKTIQWRDYVLPIGWIREEIKEVRIDKEDIAIKDAKMIGLTQARTDIVMKSGDNAHIHDEKILHEKIEGGKVYMKVLFEVEQEISTELLIIQGE
jgi:similar to stage IV sporulation protein